MRILAIDTATEACSAALLEDGSVIERYRLAPRRHAELILPMVESLLQEADLPVSAMDALAFGRGPGAFTGLRIAAGVAQGIAFGADLPVLPVSTLAALAQGVYHEQGAPRVLAGIDARMQEVYWGCFELGDGEVMALAGEEQVCAPQDVTVPAAGQWVGAGSAWQAYAEVLHGRLRGHIATWSGERYPRARDIAILAAQDFKWGLAVDAAQALPVYLRDNVVKKPSPV